MNNCNFPRCCCANPATCSNGADYFPARPDVAQHVPSSADTTDAFNLGAGQPVVEPTEAERRQFEAWMAGHNWKCATWTGNSYDDVFTRITWAAWRDRGALAAIENRRQADNQAELLEALASFLRAPSVGSNGPGSSTIVVQDFNFRAARAAITKATRRAP